MENKNSKTEGKTSRVRIIRNPKNTDEGIKNLLGSIWIVWILILLSLGGITCSASEVPKEQGDKPVMGTGNLSGQWEKLNGPYGCEISDLVVVPSDPQVVYSTVNGGGVYKSVDGGQTWLGISEDFDDLRTAWDMAIDYTNPEILYVGTWDRGLHRTMDGGLTWESITDQGTMGANAWDIAIDPTNPLVLYLGTKTGVWKSLDGGDTWVQKNSGIVWPKIFSLAIDPIDPNIVYAGTTFGTHNDIYKSINGGDNWVILNTSINERAFINSIVVDSRDYPIVYAGTDFGVYKSLDGGEYRAPSDSGITNQYIRGLTINPVNPDQIYAATWGGLFKSLDAGDNWIPLSGNFINPFIKAVAFDPSDPQIVYASVFGGLYKSHDLGESWMFYSEGLPQDVTIANENIIIDPENSQNIFVGTFGGGMFKSTDGGSTWEGINNGLPIGLTNGGGTALRSELNLTLYIGLDGAGLYESTDGGDSWHPKNNGLTNFLILALDINPYNHDVAYLGTGGGAFKTVDGGDVWYPINNGLPMNTFVRDIIIDPTNPEVVYAAVEGGIFKTTDGGNSWTFISNDLPTISLWCIDMDPYNHNILYAGTFFDGAFKSVDGGSHWFEINNGLIGYQGFRWVFDFVIDPSNSQVIYTAIDGSGVFKSVDGGETWIPWSNGLENKAMYALILDPNDPSIIYAGTQRGIFMWRPSKAILTSTDQNGNEKNEYYPGDDVWVKATGLSPYTDYKMWIQLNPVNEGDTLDLDEDPSGTQKTVTTDGNGNFENKLTWSNIPSGPPWNVEYDIVVDKQGAGEGTYNAVDDGLDAVACRGFKALKRLPEKINVTMYKNSITKPVNVSKIRFVLNAVDEVWVKGSKWSIPMELMYWQKKMKYLIEVYIDENGNVTHVFFRRWGSPMTEIPYNLAEQSLASLPPGFAIDP